MAKIIVLGAGLVGSVIAKDLAKNHQVASVDFKEDALLPLSKLGIHTIHADLSDNSTIKRLIKDYDLVVGAVPGFMGYQTLETIIKAGTVIHNPNIRAEELVTLSFGTKNLKYPL